MMPADFKGILNAVVAVTTINPGEAVVIASRGDYSNGKRSRYPYRDHRDKGRGLMDVRQKDKLKADMAK